MEWISVKDRLPDPYEWVLVKCMKIRKIEGPNIFVAYFEEYGQDIWRCAYGDGYIPPEVEIIYWRKLPE